MEWYPNENFTLRQENLINSYDLENINDKIVSKAINNLENFESVKHCNMKFLSNTEKLIGLNCKWIITLDLKVHNYNHMSDVYNINIYTNELNPILFKIIPNIETDSLIHFYDDWIIYRCKCRYFYLYIPDKKSNRLNYDCSKIAYFKDKFVVTEKSNLYNINNIYKLDSSPKISKNYTSSKIKSSTVLGFVFNDDYLVISYFESAYYIFKVYNLHNDEYYELDKIKYEHLSFDFSIYRNIFYVINTRILLSINLKTKKYYETQFTKNIIYIHKIISNTPLIICQCFSKKFATTYYFLFNIKTIKSFQKFNENFDIVNLSYLVFNNQICYFNHDIDKILMDEIKPYISPFIDDIHVGKNSTAYRNANMKFSNKSRNFKSPEVERKLTNVTKTGIPRYPLHELRSMSYPFKK
jgi:hypothetical protein